MSNTPFKVANHKLGIAGAVIISAIFSFLVVLYNGVRSPYEAAFAARQAEDSAVVWNVTHNIINNDGFIWVGAAVFLILALLCLLPAIKDAIKN